MRSKGRDNTTVCFVERVVMTKKNFGKHARSTSEQTAHTLRTVSIGAAGALVGASLALGVSPSGTPLAHAETTPATPAQSQAQTPSTHAPRVNNAPSTGVVKQSSTAQNNPLTATQNNPRTASTAGNATQGTDRAATPTPQGNDRAATPAAPQQANNEITLSKETKDTLPNMYAWGSSDNTYIEGGQKQEVKFTLKPADGVAVTKVAIFPNDNIDINGRNAKDFVEYRSDNKDAHQAYSGEYSLVTNADGSAVLTMSPMYRNNNMAAAGYAANRCIYVYGMKDGQEVLLYKTNIARAATLIPPKTTGSIVLRYDQKLEEKIFAKSFKRHWMLLLQARMANRSVIKLQMRARLKALACVTKIIKRSLIIHPITPRKRFLLPITRPMMLIK